MDPQAWVSERRRPSVVAQAWVSERRRLGVAPQAWVSERRRLGVAPQAKRGRPGVGLRTSSPRRGRPSVATTADPSRPSRAHRTRPAPLYALSLATPPLQPSPGLDGQHQSNRPQSRHPLIRIIPRHAVTAILLGSATYACNLALYYGVPRARNLSPLCYVAYTRNPVLPAAEWRAADAKQMLGDRALYTHHCSLTATFNPK